MLPGAWNNGCTQVQSGWDHHCNCNHCTLAAAGFFHPAPTWHPGQLHWSLHPSYTTDRKVQTSASKGQQHIGRTQDPIPTSTEFLLIGPSEHLAMES